MPLLLAVMVSVSAVVDALTVVVALPVLSVVAGFGEKVTSPFVANVTDCPEMPLPLASFT